MMREGNICPVNQDLCMALNIVHDVQYSGIRKRVSDSGKKSLTYSSFKSILYMRGKMKERRGRTILNVTGKRI